MRRRSAARQLGWLHEAAPDIVCLQELKARDDKFPAATLRAAGYGAVWHGRKSWNGVAILARGAKPLVVAVLPPYERVAWRA
jgi:exodeoxyribonuclease-3